MVFKIKNVWLAYVLWLFGGLFGLHLFYVGRDRQAFVYWMTFGGFFGCGWFRDMWSISSYVAEANGNPEYRKLIVEQRTQRAKPPFSLIRYLGQVVVAYIFGLLLYWSVPREEIFGCDLTWLLYFIPVAVSMGVHTVGNIGHECGSLKAPVISSVIGASVSYLLFESNPSDRLFWSCFAASSAFTFKSKQWRSVDSILDERFGFFRRVLVLSLSVTLVIALIGSGLYFNAEVTDQTGQRIKFRVMAADFLRSPEWDQLRYNLRTSYNFYKAHGWGKILQLVIDNLDPDGERRARKVLGLPPNASKQDIVARWRTLSKESHPDRHRDPVEKAAAHDKFMEYQAAYQKLIKIRGKFKATTQPVPESPSMKLDL